MTLPNDSILVTPGSGATVATHTQSSKEYQVVMEAEESGHILGSLATYLYWSEPGASANLQRILTVWNGTSSGKIIRVRRLRICHLGITAVTGVGCRIDVRQITAEPATQTNTLTAIKLDTTNATLPSQITGKNGSTAALAGSIIFSTAISTEEVATNQGAHVAIMNSINWLPESRVIQDLVLREGEGLDVQCATSTTTGVFAAQVIFTTE
jgi:hypothetical protein